MADLDLNVRLKVLELERYKAAMRQAEAANERFARHGRDARGRFVGGGSAGTYRDASGRLRAANGRFVGDGSGGGGGRSHDLGKQIRDYGSDFQRAGAKIVVASAATGYGLRRLIQPVEDYERAIVDTIAVTDDAANNIGNEQKLRKLSESFVGLGANATDTARAMEFLALAGYSTQQQMQAMPNVLFAARAGSEDVIKTAGYLSDVATGFGFGADKFQRVSDVMTYVNNATATTLSSTAEAMKEIGPYAQIAGLDFEKMAAAVGVLANAGFRGRQAGTALRNMLLSFTKMSDPARAELKKLGLEQEDFIKLIDRGDLQGAILKLDEAVAKKGYGAGGKMRVMNTIFQRFTSAKEMSLALNAVREGKWDELTAGAKASTGSAEKVARRKLDSDAGRMDVMRAKFEQMQVRVGQKILPALLPIGEELVESLEKLAAWVERNPGTAKFIAGTAAQLAILGTVAGPAMTALGGLTRLVGKFTSMSGLGGGAASAASAFGEAGTTAAGAAGKVGMLNKALGGAGLLASSATAGVAVGMLADEMLGLSDRLSGVRSGVDSNVSGSGWLSSLLGNETEDYKGTGQRTAHRRGAGYLTKDESAEMREIDAELATLRNAKATADAARMRRLNLGDSTGYDEAIANEARFNELERRKSGISAKAQRRSDEFHATREKLLPTFEARAVELREMRKELQARRVATADMKGRTGRKARAEVERAQQEYLRQEMITQSKAQRTGLLSGGEDWRRALNVDITVKDGRVETKVNERKINPDAGVFSLGM